MRNRILIVGAGLGGLALAEGLARSGFNVTVFERDESPTSREQGYRISIRSLGMQALSELLTPEKMSRLPGAKVADVGDGFTCANEKMEPIFCVPLGQDAAHQFIRSELRSLLIEGIHVEWGKCLVKFDHNNDQVIAHFADGSHAVGDLLVGCDGAGSIVRERLPSVYGKVVKSNQVILGGQIDRTPEWEELLPLNKKGIVRFQGEKHFMGVCFSERADRSPTVFWAVSGERGDFESPLQILNHCKQLIDSEPWHENLKKLINKTPVESIFAPWIVRTTHFSDFDQFPIVSSGRVTILGDAAHAMPTEKGLGGNHALEDARVLSTLLANAEKPMNLPKLIEAFEREMFNRTKIAVRESESASEYFRGLRFYTQ
jgi:2-polyprenyl-6-methoxyphenol hydroxylase-like FAD-dependent oxidoreductase